MTSIAKFMKPKRKVSISKTQTRLDLKKNTCVKKGQARLIKTVCQKK